jgi:putative FmdB family regulatory protein
MYEFQCRDCATTFQEKRSFAAASDAAVCPVCASDNTKKQWHSVAFVTNGGTDNIPLAMSHSGGCGCGNGACGCGH